jgi:hypothetical protein
VAPTNYSEFTGTIPELEALYNLDPTILINLIGAPLTTDRDDILEWAPMENVVILPFKLPGEYAAVPSADILAEYENEIFRWHHGKAYCIGMAWEVFNEDTSGIYDKLNVAFSGTPIFTRNAGAGPEMIESASFLQKLTTSADIDVNAYAISGFSSIEFITDGAGGNKDAEDLLVQLAFILE